MCGMKDSFELKFGFLNYIYGISNYRIWSDQQDEAPPGILTVYYQCRFTGMYCLVPISKYTHNQPEQGRLQQQATLSSDAVVGRLIYIPSNMAPMRRLPSPAGLAVAKAGPAQILTPKYIRNWMLLKLV